jgi:hypothetical protein
MSENEKDPPLAGKPKPSSLTDFEIKALKLQKEGKLEEFQKEIDAVTSGREAPAPEDLKETASEPDMAAYNTILNKVKNPVSLDKVPLKQRRQIEEGLALLKEIVEDKPRYDELKAAHDNAFKKSKEKSNPLKAAVIPDELKPTIKQEPKVVPPTSGDVSTTKEAEAPTPPPKVEQTKEEKIAFINDIKTDAAEVRRPKKAKEKPSIMPEDNTIEQPTRPMFDLMPECPHCGWDLKKVDLVEVTELDKQDFVQSILGGTRHRKTYELFGGKFKVTFKALSTKESDIAYRQIVIDGQIDYNGRLMAGTDFYWRNLQAYRMVMSLESVESVSYGKVEIPSLADADIDGQSFKNLQEKLVPFLNYVLDTHLPMEGIRAVIGHAYFEFQSLCDKLQVMAESPNFWRAIV